MAATTCTACGASSSFASTDASEGASLTRRPSSWTCSMMVVLLRALGTCTSPGRTATCREYIAPRSGKTIVETNFLTDIAASQCISPRLVAHKRAHLIEEHSIFVLIIAHNIVYWVYCYLFLQSRNDVPGNTTAAVGLRTQGLTRGATVSLLYA